MFSMYVAAFLVRRRVPHNLANVGEHAEKCLEFFDVLRMVCTKHSLILFSS